MLVSVSEDDPNRFKVGASVNARFSCSEEAFVYLFNIDTSGEMAMVLPNGQQRLKKATGGLEYQFPDPGNKWILNPPLGKEWFKLIAAKRPLRFLDAMVPENDEIPFVKINDHMAGIITKELEKMPSINWTASSCSIVIEGG